MSVNSHSAGGYDWLTVWRRMYDEERAQGDAATDPNFHTTPDFWEGQAERFAAAARSTPQPDGFMRFLLPRLRPTDRLLDIGAGSGRYEPFLSQHVAHLLALEPSAAMRQHLEQNSPPTTQIIASGWPNPDVPPCDIVIAAHVLYGVREIGPFLQQMNATAQRGCYLLLAFVHPSSIAAPFWQAIHGTARLQLPGALECLAALFQLGIPANLSLVPIDNRMRFPDPSAALADLRWRLRVAPESQRDAQLHAMIQEQFEHSDDGSLYPRNLPDQAAVIWWERH